MNLTRSRTLLISVLAVFAILCSCFTDSTNAKEPPSVEKSRDEPIKYPGKRTTDKRYHHGGLPVAVGVHNYQAFRANREKPPTGETVGWTYSHQPYLAYWKGKFYLQYLSNLKEEHGPPGRTLTMTSHNGRDWSSPQVVFPKYSLAEIKPEDVPERFDNYRKAIAELEGGHIPNGTYSVMHQRMGFYIAPNERLLTLAFYSYCPNPRMGPNHGQGIGRVVREIHQNGSMGPIYFIRYNRHAGWDQSNPDVHRGYPFYTKSRDKGFVKACKDLLDDKLVTLQWWEEDRARDGFYNLKPWKVNDFEPKALSYCHRPDGAVLGIWKSQWSALSPDEGKSWTRPARCPTLMTCNAKVWIQKTEDDRYALVYNHSATRRNRFPLAVMVSEDAHIFNNLLCLQGEVPPIRYQGWAKNLGPQYVRGIAETGGDPPDNYMWNTYSMNKEDIWVSRTHVPIKGTVEKHVNQNFEDLESISELKLWNLHIPIWAPISIVPDTVCSHNRCLQLRDKEPYDYAKAVRVFPESGKVTVRFRVLLSRIGHGKLNVELQDKHGKRPMRLCFNSKWLSMDRGSTEPELVTIETGKWIDIKLKLDSKNRSYDLAVNGKWAQKNIDFANDAEGIEALNRLVFRTGSWRSDLRSLIVNGEPGAPGVYMDDAPGAGEEVAECIYLIDDVKTSMW